MGILLSFCTAHLLTTVHVHLEQRLQFTVNKSYFDEKTLTKEDYSSPMEFVQVNAQKKAEEVASRMSDKFDLIIGSDTVIVHDNHILEKPNSNDEAVEMIRKLSGQNHFVVTGVALIFRDGDGADKAGAYGIQSCASALISGINGDYFTVVGLPLHDLCKRLAKWAENCLDT
eukprot:gene10858-2934_t